jgi:hypothetical protein
MLIYMIAQAADYRLQEELVPAARSLKPEV